MVTIIKYFFGGGTYYKLSNQENEQKFKFEYCHSAVPNYIPEADNYIQKYDTLKIKDRRFKGKITIIFLDLNYEIKRIIDILNNVNWVSIAEKEYTSNELDDACWKFFNETDYHTHYLIEGYSLYPKEIEEIYKIFNKMKEKYIKNGENIDEFNSASKN